MVIVPSFDPLQPVESLEALAGRREEMQRIGAWLDAIGREVVPGLLITGPTGRGKSSILAGTHGPCNDRRLVMANVHGTGALAQPGQIGAAIVDSCVVALTKIGALEGNERGRTWLAQLAGTVPADTKYAMLSRGARGPLVASVLRYDLERLSDAATEAGYLGIVIAIDDLDDAVADGTDSDALAIAISGFSSIALLGSARSRDSLGSPANRLRGSLVEFALGTLDADGTRELLLFRNRAAPDMRFSYRELVRIHRASRGEPGAVVAIARLALDEFDGAADSGPRVSAEVLRRAHSWLVGRADEDETQAQLTKTAELLERIDQLDDQRLTAGWLLTSFEALSMREIAIVVELQSKCAMRLDAGQVDRNVDFNRIVRHMTDALEAAGLLTRQDDRYTLCRGDRFAQTYLGARAASDAFAGGDDVELARIVGRYLLVMLHNDLPSVAGEGLSTWSSVRSAEEDLALDAGLGTLEELLRADDAVGLLTTGMLWPYFDGGAPAEDKRVVGIALDLSIRLTDDGPVMQRLQRFDLALASLTDEDVQAQVDRWCAELDNWLHERRIDVGSLAAVVLSPMAGRVARGGLDFASGYYDVVELLQRGEVQEAVTLQAQLVEVARGCEDRYPWTAMLLPELYSRLGFLACVAGHPDMAENAIDQAEALVESGGEGNRFLLSFNRANARAQRDEWAAAAIQIDQALEWLDNAPDPPLDAILVLWIPSADGFTPPSPTWHVVEVAAHELRDVTVAQKASYEAMSGRWRSDEYWELASDLEPVPAALRMFAWTGIVRFGDVEGADHCLNAAHTAGAEVASELEWVRAHLARDSLPVNRNQEHGATD